jgi:hypothetical protein
MAWFRKIYAKTPLKQESDNKSWPFWSANKSNQLHSRNRTKLRRQIPT